MAAVDVPVIRDHTRAGHPTDEVCQLPIAV
jgi:hypothetical protein